MAEGAAGKSNSKKTGGVALCVHACAFDITNLERRMHDVVLHVRETHAGALAEFCATVNSQPDGRDPCLSCEFSVRPQRERLRDVDALHVTDFHEF